MSKVVYEGWMVRYGRRKIGRSFIHIRYFVLENRLLAYYNRKPQDNQVPVKTMSIDGNCRVEDRGLKTHHGHMVYVLSVYNKKEKYHRITMSAFNIQEALMWKEKIESIIDQHQESQVANGNKYVSFEYKSVMDNERTASSSDHETVPPILKTLTMRAKGVCENSLKSLKQVSCGAAPTSRKTIEDFLQVLPHVDFIQGYGMTETTAVGTRGFNDKRCHKYSSIGLLAPNMQAKVVDWNSGSSLPPGYYGELWLRGPAIMQRYLNNVEATKMAIDKDGWLRTGDIVCFDEDGYLYLIDRLKEIIKYNGYQIAPADLEAILISHPQILDAAVTADIDEAFGEIPVAVVVRKHGSTLTKEAVMDFVAMQVAPYKKIRKVVFTKSIPKSAAGKILRREFRKLFSSSSRSRL